MSAKQVTPSIKRDKALENEFRRLNDSRLPHIYEAIEHMAINRVTNNDHQATYINIYMENTQKLADILQKSIDEAGITGITLRRIAKGAEHVTNDRELLVVTVADKTSVEEVRTAVNGVLRHFAVATDFADLPDPGKKAHMPDSQFIGYPPVLKTLVKQLRKLRETPISNDPLDNNYLPPQVAGKLETLLATCNEAEQQVAAILQDINADRDNRQMHMDGAQYVKLLKQQRGEIGFDSMEAARKAIAAGR